MIDSLHNQEIDFINRIRLISRGILPPTVKGKSLSSFASMGVGAGPQGKKFYLSYSENPLNYSMITVPVYSHSHHLSKYAYPTEIADDDSGTLVTENNIRLKSIPIPNYFGKSIFNNTPIFKYVQMHCYNTLSGVLGYYCKHFDDNNECRFCEINPVGEILNMPKKQDILSLASALTETMAYEKVRTFNLTSGTFSTPDEVVHYYLEFLIELRRHNQDTSILIQHEPINDLNLFKSLAPYTNGTGIFLEIFNESKRKEICPGKAKIPISNYIRNWIEAVNTYGKGNVMTTCLVGFNIDYNEILDSIEKFAELGVKTALVLIRPFSKHMIDFTPDYLLCDEQKLINLYLKTAKILQKHVLDFKREIGPGCIGCQGCTAMHEASALINTL